MNIRKIGNFYFQSTLKDGEGIRILKRFLEDLSTDFGKKSRQFYDVVGVHSFVYRERQLHSVLAPVFSNIADAFLMESPVNRQWSETTEEKHDGQDSHGWVDYWCMHKDYNYYIELKHDFISYRSGKVRTIAIENWEKACLQLDALKDEIETQKEKAKGIFRIVLHVMPVFISGSEETLKKVDIEKLETIRNGVIENISKDRKPNWSCLWLPHEDMQGPFEYINGKESYPGVFLFAHIAEIEKESD